MILCDLHFLSFCEILLIELASMRAELSFYISATFEPRVTTWYQNNQFTLLPTRPSYHYSKKVVLVLFVFWVALWLLAPWPFLHCLIVVVAGSCLWGWESKLLWFSLACDMCTLCNGVFALPFGVIGGLCSVIVALPGHLLYYFPYNFNGDSLNGVYILPRSLFVHVNIN